MCQSVFAPVSDPGRWLRNIMVILLVLWAMNGSGLPLLIRIWV